MTEAYRAPSDIAVTRMQPEDAEAVLELHRRVWLDTFAGMEGVSAAELERHAPGADVYGKVEEMRRATAEPLETAERVWFVAKDGDRVVGFTRPWRADEENLQRLGAIYVDGEYQGSGVADKLMQQALAWSDPRKPLYLWVAARNERAQGFYRRWGFELVEGAYKEIYGQVPHVQMARNGDEQ